MNPTLKNILAVIAGVLIGSIVNSVCIQLGSGIIPLPPEMNPNDTKSFFENAHLLETKHFIVPILAHALGTLVGAFAAAKIAAKYNMSYAIAVGFFFLIGGIIMVVFLPSPIWVIVVDLGLAYIPMAYLGGKLALKK